MSSTPAVIDKAPNSEASSSSICAGASPCPLCSSEKVFEFLVGPDRFHMRHDLYTLMRCSHCGCVWQANPPRPEDMGPHYDEDYHRAIMAAGEGSALVRWKDQTDVVLNHAKSGSILDIGCSSGGFLSTLKDKSWKLHGIEMEPATGEKARKNTGAEVFVGDAMDAPFPPGSFDVVTTFDVLEHVYQPRQFLMKIRDWLKPGGIYYTRLPNIDSWESRMFGSYWFGLELPRHLFHWSPKTLSAAMTSLGFEVVRVTTPPTTYVEYSAHYLYNRAMEKLGVSTRALAKPGNPGIPFKVLRKAVRLSIQMPFALMESAAVAGPNIDAIFKKPER